MTLWVALSTDSEDKRVAFGPFTSEADAREYAAQRWTFDPSCAWHVCELRSLAGASEEKGSTDEL